MAINLFTKTYLAGHGSSEPPNFLVCEQDDRRAEAFLRELREKGGSELSGLVNRVGSGREWVFRVRSGLSVDLMSYCGGWPLQLRGS